MPRRVSRVPVANVRRVRRARQRRPNGPQAQRLQRNEVVERGIPGFRALKYKAKLNYYDVITVSTGAGMAGTYVFSANGLYDPDITGTGHQPMPFDQLMLSFDHYCVTRAKITVNFRNTSSTTSVGVGLSINATNTATTNYQYLIENGVMVRDRLALAGSDDSIKTLSLPINISTFGGVPNLLDNPDYWGTIAANPAEQSFFHISFWNPDGSTVIGGTICEVFIEYESWFLEPRKNSSSVNVALKRLILAEEKVLHVSK